MLEFILRAIYKYVNEYVPEIVHIDLYKGDVISDIRNGSLEAIARPALFLEFDTLNANGLLGNTNQRFSSSVTFHLITDAYGSFSYDSDNFDINVKQLSLIDDIYKKLNGLNEISVNNEEYIISNFSRTSLEFPEELGNLMGVKSSFEFVVLDNTKNYKPSETEINEFNTEVELNNS